MVEYEILMGENDDGDGFADENMYAFAVQTNFESSL